jgi:uncharacterized protein
MSKLNAEILQLLDLPATTKIVATTDELGKPYAVASTFLQAGSDGALVHLELLEKSATNRNLLRSLWFDKKVSVTLCAADGRSFVIQGKPVKACISGLLFRHHYQRVRALLGDVDLASVWLIEPEEVVDETYAVRKKSEEERFPFSVHLDRLVAPTLQAVSK